MKVSCNRVDITPDNPVDTARTAKGIQSDIIVDRLEANIVLLPMENGGNLTLVGIDSVFSSSELELEVHRCLTSENVSLVVVATHTHNSPILSHEFADAMERRGSCIKETATAIARAIDECLKRRKETVSFHRGQVTCPGSVYRRKRTFTFDPRKRPHFSLSYGMASNRSHSINRNLDLMIASSDIDGSPQFIIWSWPCHATASAKQSAVEADFPGVVRDRLREEYGADIPIVYLPGFCGDIRPDISTYFSLNKARVLMPFARLFANNTEQKYRAFAINTAEAAVRAGSRLEKVHVNDVIVLSSVDIPLREMFEGECPDLFKAHRLRSGDIDLLLVEAEVCSGYEDLLKPFVSKNTIFSGLTGEVYGYLPTDQQIAEGGYEADRFIDSFPLRGKYKSHIQKIVCNSIRTLYQNEK